MDLVGETAVAAPPVERSALGASLIMNQNLGKLNNSCVMSQVKSQSMGFRFSSIQAVQSLQIPLPKINRGSSSL